MSVGEKLFDQRWVALNSPKDLGPKLSKGRIIGGQIDDKDVHEKFIVPAKPGVMSLARGDGD